MDQNSIFVDLPPIKRSTQAIGWFTFILTLIFLSAPFWSSVDFFAVSSNYLPLHTAMETFSVIVAALVFAIGWNTHTHGRPDNFLLLACTFLAVGILDFLHTLSYAGMPELVTPASPEKAINFWLAARFLVAASLLIVAFRPWTAPKKIHPRFSWFFLSLVIVSISSGIILFRPEIIPHTFIPGQGLTKVKIASEYLIVAIHLLTAILFWLRRNSEQNINLGILAAASIVMGLAELFFTLYSTVTNLYNLSGHIYKVIAYSMIYRAIFVSSVKEPYQRLQQTSLMRLKLTQFAVDHSAEMVFWINASGKILNANNAALQSLGYEIKDLTERHLSNIEQGLSYQDWNTLWKTVKKEGKLERETLLQTVTGKLIPVEINANYVAVEDNEYLCSFVRDISGRKQTENILRNSEYKFKEAQKIAHVGSWELDLINDKLTWTAEVFHIFEIDPKSFEASYQGFLDVIHPEDRELVDNAYKKSIIEHIPYGIRHRLLLANGTIKHVKEHGQTSYSEDGQPVRSVGTIQDITRMVESEQALKSINNELSARADELLEMSELLLTCLTAEECFNVSVSFCQRLFPDSSGALFILDSSQELAEAMAVWGSNPPVETLFEVSQCWTLRLNREKQVDEADSALICPHIKEIPPAGYIGMPIYAHGELLGAMELCWPVSHLQLDKEKRKSTRDSLIKTAHSLVDHLALALINLRLRDSLQKQAIHDPLTGLYNRRYLEDALGREVRRAARDKTSFGIIMIDIDHFKHINDQYGHNAGDVLLKAIATLFRSHLRGEDLVCRYGGEEFIALLPTANSKETICKAEEIRQKVENHFIEHEGQQIGPVTISAGVSIYPAHGRTPESLIKAADDALYLAKNGGRNKVLSA